MVTATIDNPPVSIQLADGESTTVPTGEIWKVTIQHTDSGSGTTSISLNGTEITNAEDSTNGEGGADERNETLHCVLEGGDTISLSGGLSCQIGGYKLST